ncbi:MAG: hypothetical protein IPF81_14290 [Bacteroidetes bacterium]|nr:hypothetical protein [Bacteroidota bacterium]
MIGIHAGICRWIPVFPYAFSIGDKGFIGGGWQLTELNDLWQYDTFVECLDPKIVTSG